MTQTLFELLGSLNLVIESSDKTTGVTGIVEKVTGVWQVVILFPFLVPDVKGSPPFRPHGPSKLDKVGAKEKVRFPNLKSNQST